MKLLSIGALLALLFCVSLVDSKRSPDTDTSEDALDHGPKFCFNKEDMKIIQLHLYQHINELFMLLYECKKRGIPATECYFTLDDHVSEPHRERPYESGNEAPPGSTDYRTDQPSFHSSGGTNEPQPFHHPGEQRPPPHHPLPEPPNHTLSTNFQGNHSFPSFQRRGYKNYRGNRRPSHMNTEARNVSSEYEWHVSQCLTLFYVTAQASHQPPVVGTHIPHNSNQTPHTSNDGP
ncbi:hypothetical protein EGR_04921 [Echinococcus granulosus]|uniref:Uncharacterized protein n=1 Tax=Echinococcus granulosus TaxID=6210 RepID=W6UGU1_ECHGR|nr:hypothetical protein EGR_04921 [Echinococcus granulosus]EUB60211.1 hypothetical protein EGR_04921 [Echinococcus granulosus]